MEAPESFIRQLKMIILCFDLYLARHNAFSWECFSSAARTHCAEARDAFLFALASFFADLAFSSFASHALPTGLAAHRTQLQCDSHLGIAKHAHDIHVLPPHAR